MGRASPRKSSATEDNSALDAPEGSGGVVRHCDLSHNASLHLLRFFSMTFPCL